MFSFRSDLDNRRHRRPHAAQPAQPTGASLTNYKLVALLASHPRMDALFQKHPTVKFCGVITWVLAPSMAPRVAPSPTGDAVSRLFVV